MNCKLCGEPIVLVPSAEERAKRYGGKASDYTGLFQTHAKCQVEANMRAVKELIARNTKAC